MGVLGPEVVLACALGMLALRLGRAGGQYPGPRWPLILISAGVVAYWQPFGLAVTLVLTGVAWVVIREARRAQPPHQAPLVGLGVAIFLIALVGFKYAPWLAGILPPEDGGRTRSALVPLGLSFTVFRLIGAILDGVGLKAAVSGPDLLLLAVFFPTYLAGPLATAASLSPHPASERAAEIRRAALARILRGLFRKVALADPLQSLVIEPWLAGGVQDLSPERCALLLLAFGFNVYWDFAGYSDMAIGIAALLGYRVPENFDRPYLSRNLVQFWQRWHITLSDWIRLRLFMKMTGRRPSFWRVSGATLVSMALCGLWHGAGLNFLLWGLWHGAGLVAVHLLEDVGRRNDALRRWSDRPEADVLSTALTFTYVTAGWALFFLPAGSAAVLLARAFAPSPGNPGLPLLAAASLAAGLARRLPPPRALPLMVRSLAWAMGAGVVVYRLVCQGSGPREFMYAQF